MINLQIDAEKIESAHSLTRDIARLLKLPAPPELLTVDKEIMPTHFVELVKYKNFLVNAIIEKEIDFNNDALMFKEFLDYYSLRAPFDVEKYINEGDIVEVYGEDFVQIYRNRTFFTFCNYDIYTVLAHPFNVLFRRDDAITQKIMKRASECLSTAKGIEPIGVEKNLMQEHYARNNKVFEVTHKWCSPIYSRVTENKMALFCTQQAKQIGQSNIHGIGFVSH